MKILSYKWNELKLGCPSVMDKNKYTGLWLLLALALIIIIFISFYDDLKLGDWNIKKAPIAESLLKKERHDSITGVTGEKDIPEEKIKVVVTDSMPQTIFIFGDSMTFNLALRLAQYAKQNGHTIHSVNWDSSNTKIWAETDTLKHYVEKWHPTQIFISLGSNEIYFKDPTLRKPYIERIIEIIDTIPFIWIGPPNWKEDSGINDLIEELCGKGSFFRSKGMEFERKADHIHPTRAASILWVDSIMRWLPKSSHPFVAEIPSDTIGKCNPNIVFLKARNK